MSASNASLPEAVGSDIALGLKRRDPPCAGLIQVNAFLAMHAETCSGGIN